MELDLPVWRKQLKKQTEYMKEQFSETEHQTAQDRDPWERVQKWGEPYNCLRLKEKFQAAEQGVGTQVKRSYLSELRIWS